MRTLLRRTLPRHIVAIRPGAVGDTLLALPALAWLRRSVPKASILLAARGDVLPLARSSGVADAVSDYSLPVWADLFADVVPARSPLRDTVSAKAVIAWLPDRDGTVARNLAAGGAAP